MKKINIHVIKTKLPYNNYFKTQYDEFNIEYFDYESGLINKIVKNMATNSLFFNKSIKIIKNSVFLTTGIHKLKKKEEILLDELMRNYENYNDEIIFLVDKPINSKISYVSKYIENFEISELTDQKIIIDLCEKNKIKYQQKAIDYIINNIDPNYSIIHEINKFLILEEELTVSNLKSLLPHKIDDLIFEFIQCLMEDKNKALTMYKKNILVKDFKQEQILAIMSSQLKFMMQVYVLSKYYNETIISQKLGASNYRVKKTKQFIQGINVQVLKKTYQSVAEYDYLIKSGRTKERDVIINFFV